MQYLAQAFAANCICEIHCLKHYMGSISILFTNLAVIRKNHGKGGIQTRGIWVKSANATSVALLPPT